MIENSRRPIVLGVVVALSCLAAALLLQVAGCESSPKARPVAAPTMRYPTSQQAWTPLPLESAMAMIDARDAWGDFPAVHVPRHPAEKHLAGLCIVLDPGHGASDGETDPTYKRGPTGVREDDVNLRVALLLERLLCDAGAHVTLTRRQDVIVGLRERAEIANELPRPDGDRGADLFISLHHNAAGPTANYSSVWHHGAVDDAEPELDVARSLAMALGRELRTDVARTSPVLSDQLMYASGFGVLRATRVPAVLVEASFFSNPDEEQRLRDAGYNLREAYALYVGLCEWAYAGRPTQSLPAVAVDGSRVTLTSTLSERLPAWWGSDRNRILQSSLDVRLNGRKIPYTFDVPRKLLTVSLDASPDALARQEGGVHELRIVHANFLKNHNYPQRYELRFEPGGVAQVRALGPKRWERASTQAAGRAGG